MDNEKVLPKVFVITPFDDDFLSLYEELKKEFNENFNFNNAGDLDNQQNILQDIVEGIHQADVVIADLTGLNPNVFYELGLAHAMNKKVIIITQDIGELPFDIKSYRANEYSLQFNKLPKLIDELKVLLNGAIDGKVKYGSPISDYIPNFFKVEIIESPQNDNITAYQEDIIDISENGFLDYIEDINEYSEKISDEIEAICEEMNDMASSVTRTTNQIENLDSQKENTDPKFIRNVFRKLSSPIDVFAEKLKSHIDNVNTYWEFVENSYLLLLDNQHTQTVESDEIKKSILSLEEMQDAIYESDGGIEAFIDVLRGCQGMERRLNKAISALIAELERYLQMTNIMASSTDRIISKSEIVLASLNENN